MCKVIVTSGSKVVVNFLTIGQLCKVETLSGAKMGNIVIITYLNAKLRFI